MLHAICLRASFAMHLCHAPFPSTTYACDSNQDADEIDLPEGFAIGVCFSVGKMAPSQIATCNMQKPSPQGKETTTSLFGAGASVSFRSQPTKRSKSRKGCHLVAWICTARPADLPISQAESVPQGAEAHYQKNCMILYVCIYIVSLIAAWGNTYIYNDIWCVYYICRYSTHTYTTYIHRMSLRSYLHVCTLRIFKHLHDIGFLSCLASGEFVWRLWMRF